LELLPSKCPGWNLENGENKKAEKDYLNICLEKFNLEKTDGWGFLLNQKGAYKFFVKNEREKFKKLIASYEQKELAIDVSAGCGNYDVYLSSLVSRMVHCEAQTSALTSAFKLATKLNINNIVFIRSNYLNLPFNDGIFDIVICTDTLERGKNHEIQALKEIYRILKNGGHAIVDFHNKRKLLDRIRNPYIKTYTKKEIKNLLKEALDIDDFKIYPVGHFPTSFIQNETVYKILDKIFFFLPPIRFIVELKKK